MTARTDGLSIQATSRPQGRRVAMERESAAQESGTPFANVLDAEERATARAQARAADDSPAPDGSRAKPDSEREATSAGAKPERAASSPPARTERRRDPAEEAGVDEDRQADAQSPADDSAVATILGLCAAPTDAAASGQADPPSTASGGSPGDWSAALLNLPAAANAPATNPLNDLETSGAGPGDASAAAPAVLGDSKGQASVATTMLIAAATAEGSLDAGAAGTTTDAAIGATAPDASAVAGFGDTRGAARSATPERPIIPASPPELRSPPGTTSWSDELGSRVTWMVERGEQVASLKLSPEHMGPLEVRIAVREGETSIWFGAAQADTRAALEQSLPRLREMLGNSGLSLANAGVFSHTPRDPQRGFTAAALARAARESGTDPQSAVVTSLTRRGLVDLYA